MSIRPRCTVCGVVCEKREGEYLLSQTEQYVCSYFCKNSLDGKNSEATVCVPADISDTLKERGADYGKFSVQAAISQSLEDTMRESPNWDKLDPDMKEALKLTVHKIARILNGNINKVDSWFDIEGYIRLVRVRLEAGEKI